MKLYVLVVVLFLESFIFLSIGKLLNHIQCQSIMRTINPHKLHQVIYDAVVDIMSNPMPLGAVCRTGTSRQGAVANLPIGKIFYISDGEGERIFKMRAIQDKDGTGRYIDAKLIRIVQTHPKNRTVGEYFLDRIRDGHITLMTMDDRYID